MTTRTLRRTATVTGHYLPRDHVVYGTPVQLAAIVDNHRSAGTLITITAPRRVRDGRFQMVIRIREYHSGPAPTTISLYTTARTRHHRRVALTVTTITGAAAGIITVGAYLMGQLIELITTHPAATVGVLALLGLLAVALIRHARACAGPR